MYKVLREDNTSAVTNFIQYIPGEWTYPEVGKLFVFEEFEDARNFIWKARNYGIWVCKVKNPVPLELALHYRDVASDSVKWFWEGGYEELSSHNVRPYPTPEGTYVCDAVKLVREIK